MIAIDSIISNFELPSTGDKNFSLAKNLGKNIVIYFYPKDDTPGCTTEGQDFRNGIERSTFVIDAEGKLRKEWRGVKVPGHVEEVLSFVTAAL